MVRHPGLRSARLRIVAASLAALSTAGLCGPAWAGPGNLTFSFGYGWSNDGRKNDAGWAMQQVLNRFNAYGDFSTYGDRNVEINYNAGVPTAQSGFGGSGSGHRLRRNLPQRTRHPARIQPLGRHGHGQRNSTTASTPAAAGPATGKPGRSTNSSTATARSSANPASTSTPTA